MKKNTIIISVLAIVLAIVAIFLAGKNNTNTVREELRDFAITDTSTVTKIFLASKSGSHSTLVKNTDGTWTVNDKYEVRPDAIKTLLLTMQKLEIYKPVASSAEPSVIKSMATKAIKVEVYQNNDHKKPSKVYYVGGPTQNQLGTYMLLENSSKAFVMHIPGFNGYLSTRYFTSEDEWRNRELFSFDRDEIASVELKNFIAPQYSYTIINKSNAGEEHTFELLNSQGEIVTQIDTLKIATYLTFFENLHLESFDTSIKKEKKDSIISAGPNFILTIKDKNGGQRSLTMYNMPLTAKSSVQTDRDGNPLTIDRDRFYGIIDQEETFVVLQYFVFEKILRIADEFMYQKKPQMRQPV